ncbi:MAG: VOC family protein [Elainellaceae cyanobacterium]
MHIKSIHHVAIICSDYKWSKLFYTEILGFPVIEETYRAERDSYKLDLKVGDRDRIELFSFPNPPTRPSRPEARGLRHLSFAVEDVEKMVEYLIEQGVDVEPVRVDKITNRKFTFFFDPDELPLEIYEAES